MELIARFIINTFAGSIVAFYLTLLLVILLRLVIRNYRALYYLYLLPLFKVTYDLLFASHTNWIYLNGKEILNAPTGSRILSAFAAMPGHPFTELKFHLSEGYTFSLGDIAAEIIPIPFLYGVAGVIAFCTLFSLTRFGLRLKHSFLPIDATELKSPLLIGFWKGKIIIPKHLLKVLSDQELEAIYAHEKKHILWKDTLLNLFVEALSALFWFIPFKNKILKKASFYRELSCDLGAKRLDLVAALQKTASHSPLLGILAFSTFDRADWILNKKGPGKVAMILSIIFLLGGGAAIIASHFLPF